MNNKQTLDKIGADIEYFAVNNENEVVSAIGLIGGTKDAPLWVTNGNLQEDNISAEMATIPCSTADEFSTSIFSLRKELDGKLREHGLTSMCSPYHVFTLQELHSFGRKATILGCDPDYNAYTGMRNSSPNGNRNTMRTNSGHVHFSYTNPEEDLTRDIVLNMDYLLGLWSVLVDTDDARRVLYGKAGSYRPKEYGGEYRSLSSFWTTTKNNIDFVYNMTKKAVEGGKEMADKFLEIDYDEVEDAINEY